jgi:hypothetical protein
MAIAPVNVKVSQQEMVKYQNLAAERDSLQLLAQKQTGSNHNGKTDSQTINDEK